MAVIQLLGRYFRLLYHSSFIRKPFPLFHCDLLEFTPCWREMSPYSDIYDALYGLSTKLVTIRIICFRSVVILFSVRAIICFLPIFIILLFYPSFICIRRFNKFFVVVYNVFTHSSRYCFAKLCITSFQQKSFQPTTIITRLHKAGDIWPEFIDQLHFFEHYLRILKVWSLFDNINHSLNKNHFPSWFICDSCEAFDCVYSYGKTPSLRYS